MGLNYSSGSICRVVSVFLVAFLAVVSHAPAQGGSNGCFGSAADSTDFGWGYSVYITDTTKQIVEAKCGPAELSPFGVVHDSRQIDNWTIQINGEYELVMSPGQIALTQTIAGQAHNARTANDPGMSGAVGASVIWWDTITPHRLDKTPNSKHMYMPKPTLQQLSNNPTAYLVKLTAKALTDPPPTCTATGDTQAYWYSMIASLIVFNREWPQDAAAVAPPGSPVALDKSLLVGDVAPGHGKCVKGPLDGDFAAFDGWPMKIRLNMRSVVMAGSPLTGPGIGGAKPTSGNTEVEVPDFHICIVDPPGIEVTSASGHDYSCGAIAAAAAK
jgi:hypothetical protein